MKMNRQIAIACMICNRESTISLKTFFGTNMFVIAFKKNVENELSAEKYSKNPEIRG